MTAQEVVSKAEAKDAAEVPVRTTRRRHITLLLLASCIVFANTLHNGYHLDDFNRIRNNPEIDRVWSPLRHFLDPGTSSIRPGTVAYRPLLPFSLSLTAALGDRLGLDRKVAHHIGNLGIHTLSAILLYLLFAQLLRPASGTALKEKPDRVALFAALLFAIHPVSGVPVNYLCARDLLLMQLLFVTFLLAHVAVRRREPAYCWLLPMTMLTLALLAKTNAVAAPLVILFFELSVGRGRLLAPHAWIIRVLPAALVVVGFIVFTRFALNFSDAGQVLVDHPPLAYPLTQLELHLTHYLRNFLWPFLMRVLPQLEVVDSPLRPPVILGFLLVLSSLVTAWRWRHRAPPVAFAVAAYWTLFAPTSSILPLRMLATDYRQYPSLPWLCLLLAIAAGCLCSGRRFSLLSTTVLAFFAGSSIYLNLSWKDEESLWGRSVRFGGSAVAHNNYGLAVAGRDPELAEKHYRVSLRIMPGYAIAHINLGLAFMAKGRTEEGLGHIRRAVALQPLEGRSQYWLARALSRSGQPHEAATESARAIELDPRNPRFAYQAARHAQAVGDHEAALQHLEVLHSLKEHHKNSHFMRAWSLYRLGRIDEAIAAYRRCIDTRPDYAQAHFNLAYSLWETDRCDHAIANFLRVLELKPDYHEVHLHLAKCYRAMGDIARAEKHAAVWSSRPR